MDFSKIEINLLILAFVILTCHTNTRARARTIYAFGFRAWIQFECRTVPIEWNALFIVTCVAHFTRLKFKLISTNLIQMSKANFQRWNVLFNAWIVMKTEKPTSLMFYSWFTHNDKIHLNEIHLKNKKIKNKKWNFLIWFDSWNWSIDFMSSKIKSSWWWKEMSLAYTPEKEFNWILFFFFLFLVTAASVRTQCNKL